MKRRILLTGALGGALTILAGCGKRSIYDVNDELVARPHITEARLVLTGGLGLRDGIAGHLTFDVDGDAFMRALDSAWRVVTEFIFELDEGKDRRIIQVAARRADGTDIDPGKLLGGRFAEPAVTASFEPFYERYGLR